MAAEGARNGRRRERATASGRHARGDLDDLDGTPPLSRYDRASVGLWARSHAESTGRVPGCWAAAPDGGGGSAVDGDAPGPPAAPTAPAAPAAQVAPVCIWETAVHAVLTGLRRCADLPALFARYAADARADFALIDSLVPALPATTRDAAHGIDGNHERRFQVRDAAFYLRWLELTRPLDGRLPTPRAGEERGSG